jgi:hypothetical protein
LPPRFELRMTTDTTKMILNHTLAHSGSRSTTPRAWKRSHWSQGGIQSRCRALLPIEATGLHR